MPRLALALTLAALALCLLSAGAGAASAATTRYAAPTAAPKASDCTNVADPCPLLSALQQAQAGDNISLAAGSYDVEQIALAAIPLHWVATKPGTHPRLISAGADATIALGPAQSGSSFDGIDITKAQPALAATPTAALQVGPDVDAAVRSAVIAGPVCVDAPKAGALTIDQSRLTSPLSWTCAQLGVSSTLRRSTVDRGDGLVKGTAPPSVVTAGVVEDSKVDGGLQLVGPAAVARRVTATGTTAIWGQGLVVDSVARAIGSEGAAIAADAQGGGILRVVNATAVAAEAPALEARPVRAAEALVVGANVLQVSNTIAHGTPSDIAAVGSSTCSVPENACESGRIEIDHSNFARRDPAAGSADASLITEGAGNQSTDPRFANAGAGDLHLRAGSPAIDAGAAQAQALALDLDGQPRAQGAAIDLGAYETPGAAPGSGSGGPAGGGASGAIDTRAPILGRLRLLHSRFRVGARATAITTTTSEAGRVTFAVQQRIAGHRDHGRCATHGPKKAARCTHWVAQGRALTRLVASPGRVTLAFSGRIGSRRLSPGRYRFVVTATDAAGNRSPVRTVGFTVIGRRS